MGTLFTINQPGGAGSSGLGNELLGVRAGVEVQFNAEAAASYAWSFAKKPYAENPAITNATTQNATCTFPAVAGRYQLRLLTPAGGEIRIIEVSKDAAGDDLSFRQIPPSEDEQKGMSPVSEKGAADVLERWATANAETFEDHATRIETLEEDGGGDTSVYSVRDFGAVGDGATDDSAAVSAAIAALVASGSGGTIFFPPGTYAIAANTTLADMSGNGAGIAMRGAGPKSVVRLMGGGLLSYAFRFANADAETLISDIAFEGHGINTDVDAVCVIQASSTGAAIFERVSFYSLRCEGLSDGSIVQTIATGAVVFRSCRWHLCGAEVGCVVPDGFRDVSYVDCQWRDVGQLNGNPAQPAKTYDSMGPWIALRGPTDNTFGANRASVHVLRCTFDEGPHVAASFVPTSGQINEVHLEKVGILSPARGITAGLVHACLFADTDVVRIDGMSIGNGAGGTSNASQAFTFEGVGLIEIDRLRIVAGMNANAIQTDSDCPMLLIRDSAGYTLDADAATYVDEIVADTHAVHDRRKVALASDTLDIYGDSLQQTIRDAAGTTAFVGQFDNLFSELRSTGQLRIGCGYGYALDLNLGASWLRYLDIGSGAVVGHMRAFDDYLPTDATPLDVTIATAVARTRGYHLRVSAQTSGSEECTFVFDWAGRLVSGAADFVSGFAPIAVWESTAGLSGVTAEIVATGTAFSLHFVGLAATSLTVQIILREGLPS